MGRTARIRSGATLTVGGVVALALLAGTPPAAAAPVPAAPVLAAPAGCTPAVAQPAPAPATRSLVGALLGAVAPAVAVAPAAVPTPKPTPCVRRSTGEDTSAGALLDWGTPARADDFDGTKLGPIWSVYDGPGHAGKGRRTPKAVTVRDGIMTITGDERGATAGMAWGSGLRYGRWEGRVKAPASDESYNALLLLWPDAENFPVGGEIDFMEMMDHTRQKTNVFLHYGKRNRQISGSVRIDATQWHNWAVEWTPTHIATFVDGKEWWRTERTEIFPPAKMHLCVQLDWFPSSRRGPVQVSTMQVDWVKQYSIAPVELARMKAEAKRRDRR